MSSASLAKGLLKLVKYAVTTTSKMTCDRCNGKGQVKHKNTEAYFRRYCSSSYYVKCEWCNGTGKIIKKIPHR